MSLLRYHPAPSFAGRSAGGSLWQLLGLTLCLWIIATSQVAAQALPSEEAVLQAAQQLIDADDLAGAVQLLEDAEQSYPESAALLGMLGSSFYKLSNYGEAQDRLARSVNLTENPKYQALLDAIDRRLDQLTATKNMAVIVLQKETDAGNTATAIAVANKALARYPNDELLYTAYGRALLEALRLEEAELALRTALKINPKNVEARKLIEEIRATAEAQVSEEVAEWISIAKDKVGDFIVTFLALFAAFITSSLMSPVMLRIKLNQARRAFDQGNYDDFTDLMEGLLDEENFVPLRSNFRFLLKQKGYEEAKAILNKYVNTLERLPTMLRILERENEKLHDAE